jgi:Erv1 / Alr family
MYPPLFGTAMWDEALIIAFGLPEIVSDFSQEMFAQHIISMAYLTPCPGCQVDAVKYVVDHPPTKLATRNAALAYVVTFHNYVNQKLKKATMTVEEALQALKKRWSQDLKELPRALKMRTEDAERLKTYQSRISELEKNSSSSPSSSSSTDNNITIYVIVGLSILIAILLVVCAVMGRHIYKKRHHAQV